MLFLNARGPKLSDVENDAKFRILTRVKIRGGVGEISESINKRPNLRMALTAIHFAAAERGVLIKKKEKKV